MGRAVPAVGKEVLQLVSVASPGAIPSRSAEVCSPSGIPSAFREEWPREPVWSATPLLTQTFCLVFRSGGLKTVAFDARHGT